jgi:hypothetical protein
MGIVTIDYFSHDAAMTRLPTLLANATSALLDRAALRVSLRGMRARHDVGAIARLSQ